MHKTLIWPENVKSFHRKQTETLPDLSKGGAAVDFTAV